MTPAGSTRCAKTRAGGVHPCTAREPPRIGTALAPTWGACTLASWRNAPTSSLAARTHSSVGHRQDYARFPRRAYRTRVLATFTRARRASFTAFAFGKAAAMSGSSSTRFVPSEKRREYFPRTPPFNFERSSASGPRPRRTSRRWMSRASWRATRSISASPGGGSGWKRSLPSPSLA